MRVKICGITSVDDARSAARAGADAIGLNFVGGRREIDPKRARKILDAFPPLVTPVALVGLENGCIPNPLWELLGEFRVSHLQVYGEVSSDNLKTLVEYGFRPIPVVSVKDASFAEQAAQWLPDDPVERADRPHAILLDAYVPGKEGGTGQAFRWDWVSQAREAGQLTHWPPIILAGGLRPTNVAEAIRIVKPYAVDVSSGVEADHMPTKKDEAKMHAFVQNAKGAASE